jgi:hypothetical protein
MGVALASSLLSGPGSSWQHRWRGHGMAAERQGEKQFRSTRKGIDPRQ